MNIYPHGNEYADTWELARITYRAVIMRVSVSRGVIVLETIEHVTNDPMNPHGFRRFKESKFPAPIFVPGDIQRDMELARDWLELHKVHIRDAELARP